MNEIGIGAARSNAIEKSGSDKPYAPTTLTGKVTLKH